MVLEEKNIQVLSFDLVILIIIHHLQISKKKVIDLLKMHVKNFKLKSKPVKIVFMLRTILHCLTGTNFFH